MAISRSPSERVSTRTSCGKGREPGREAAIVVAAEPPPESLTVSSSSGSIRPR